MDNFLIEIYELVLYQWLISNKSLYEKHGIEFIIDDYYKYKLIYKYHGFTGCVQIWDEEHIIEETILDEHGEQLFYLHYRFQNFSSTVKFIKDFFYELFGDFDYKHIGICSSSGISSSLFVESMQELNDLLHLPYQFDALSEGEFKDKYQYFDLILLPPQSSHLKTYFMNIADKQCIVENIDATVFATNNYQSVLEDIKNIFKKVK